MSGRVDCVSQTINTEESKNSMYVFQGHQFLEYVDVSEIKSSVKEITGFEAQTGEFFEAYYTRFITERYSERELLEHAFFESIFYGRLTNVFINKIKNPLINEDVFKILVNRFINDVNSRNSLSPDIKRLMNENGFYVMDLVYTTEKNTFIAGFDYTTNEDNQVDKARFLVVQVVPTKKDNGQIAMRYLVCAVEIDYENKLFVLALKNMPNIVDHDEHDDFDEEIQRTVMKAYKKFSNLFINNLQLQKYINYKKDRTSMFDMCKHLDSVMLDELRQEVEGKTADTIKAMVDTATENLFGKPRVPLVNKDTLNLRYKSLLLATYLEVMTEDEDLIFIAKSNRLVGYPTKVSFKSKNASKGATGTSGANEPVATSIMFHSLYTDFQEALELPNWSLSWFKDIHHQTHSTEVFQTSVVSTKENLKVTFINKNHIGKELFHHVVSELSKYRDYDDSEE
jgi:hypothetical protein